MKEITDKEIKEYLLTKIGGFAAELCLLGYFIDGIAKKDWPEILVGGTGYSILKGSGWVYERVHTNNILKAFHESLLEKIRGAEDEQ